MQFNDALMVAGAGIFVVFSGLLITNLLISSLPTLIRLRSLFERSDSGAGGSTDTATTEAAGPRRLAEATPEVLAAISTVLEIERRLNFSQKINRYTFKDRKQGRSGLMR